MRLRRPIFRSIVLRTAFYAAASCALVSIVLFGILFDLQRGVYEKRLVRDAEESISRISRVFLGFFYAQGNWVYLEDQQRAFNKTNNILYNYIVNAKGVIDQGIHGFQSPDLGQKKQPWEPDQSLATDWESHQIAFMADSALSKETKGRVQPGDRLTLITTPIDCLGHNEICGYLRVAVTFESIRATLQNLRLNFIFAGVILTFATFAIVFVTTRRTLLPIRIMSERMRNLAQHSSQVYGNDTEVAKKLSEKSGHEAEETQFFRESLEEFTTAFQRTASLENELKVSRSLSDLAAQVAHDIRSPLAALEIVSSSLSGLPEDRRVMLRSALARIRDIANNLLSDNAPQLRGGRGSLAQEPIIRVPDSTVGNPSVYLLASLVDGLISEKRIQYRSRIGVDIERAQSVNSYGLFVRVDADGLKRVLSNVINNAVEAIEFRGVVTIGIEATAEAARIHIHDTGKGIPADIMPRLMNKGFSHGKKDGSGLGLFHAKNAVEAWGGKVELTSPPGKGTSVILCLPLVNPPSWFVPEIRVPAGSRVIVLDDDTSIHQVWRGRFENIPKDTVEVRHFSMPEELVHWYRGQGKSSLPTLYLIDFEFVESSRTGLDLVKELGIAHSAILVTSRFEEESVLNECLRLGIRLIPKGQAGFVPIQYSGSPERPDFVLIDDDVLIRDAWKSRLGGMGKDLRVFEGSEAFRKVAGEYDRRTKIYIDSSLGTELKGEEFAKQLAELGFTELYLATGYPASFFDPMPWLKGIVSKDPPSN